MAEQPEFPGVLDTLRAEIIERLGGSLIGLYLYGSLVVGDFDDQRSDVDLLAVTSELLSPGTERDMAEMHESIALRFPEWEDRLEVGYFPIAVIRDFAEPLGDVHRISPGEPFHRTPALPHWLTDLYSVQEHGHVLYGPSVTDVLPRIGPGRFQATIRHVVGEWRDWVVGVEEQRHQAYARLTMFRSWYAYTHARQISKIGAAEWFAAEFPQWRIEAELAVVWRRRDSTVVDLPGAERTEELVNFVYARTRA